MKYFLLFFLSVFSLNAFTQNDPNAKKLLDAATNKAKSFSSVTANFSLSVITKAGKSAGTGTGIISRKGTKFRMDTKDIQVYYNDTTFWHYDVESNEVSIAKKNLSSNYPPALFFTNFYDKDFLYKLNGSKQVGGVSLAEIELTPSVKNKSYSKIYVFVNTAQSYISSMKYIENSGNSYTFNLSNLKANAGLSDNIFVFDKSKHPGVEVKSEDVSSPLQLRVNNNYKIVIPQ